MTINEYHDKKLHLDAKIKTVLTYVGAVAAIVFGIVYIALLLVLILGFESAIDPSQQWLFVGLGAAVGLVIDVSLMSQGIALAKRVEGSEAIMRAYYEAKNAITKKQPKTIEHFVVKHLITTVLSKVLFAAASLYLIVHFVIVGSQDMTLLLLGIANLFMFTGFGFMSLASSYDYYLEQHLPAIKAKTTQLKTPAGVCTSSTGVQNANLQLNGIPHGSTTSQ